MFNLDQAIAEWRRQMLAAGIKPLVTLDELENHLREEIRQQIESGTEAQPAFEIAVKKIGSPAQLKTEFKKAGIHPGARMVNLAGIAYVTIACLFSAWTLPFLFHHEIGWLWKVLGLGAVAATISGWRYNHRFLPAVHRPLMRSTIGFLGSVISLAWILCFIVNFMPALMRHPPGMDVPAGQLMAAFLWGWTLMAVLGGIGHGLEKVAAKRNLEAVA